MRRVLACVDLSESSEAVVECARELAAPDGALTILHVAAPEPDFVGYDPGPSSVRDNVARDLKREHQAVQQLAARVRTASLHVTPLTVQGMTVDRIAEHAGRLGVNWIVVASKGHGMLHDLVVGSVARELMRRATVPVVVVPFRAKALPVPP